MQRLFILILLGVAACGCAIHPLPDDTTGLSTNIIVRQIRCETREAVIETIFGYLTNDKNFKGNKVDQNSYNVGQIYNEYRTTNPSKISQFDPKQLTGFARTVVGTLWNTGIAYNYDLEMTEVNNIDPSLNFLQTIPGAARALALGGNFDRSRQNARTFTVTDNLGALVQKVHSDYCPTQYLAGPNLIYPIAGSVGMKRVVQDFLNLALFDNLSGDASKDVTATKGPPSMVDQLSFETTVGGTTNPKVTFTPITSAFHMADATLGLAASRKDVHKLTVGLYIAQQGVRPLRDTRAGIFQGFVTANGGAPEQGAAHVVDQFLQQKALQPKIVLPSGSI